MDKWIHKKDAIIVRPTFEEVLGVYKVPPIDWHSYIEFTKSVVDKATRQLLRYDDCYWTIGIKMQASGGKVGDEGFDYAHNKEL